MRWAGAILVDSHAENEVATSRPENCHQIIEEDMPDALWTAERETWQVGEPIGKCRVNRGGRNS
jgi:hypothetical protein